MITKVLGIDFETQDDKAEITNITEVGAILSSVEHSGPNFPDKWDVEQSFSTLCWENSYPSQTPDIVELTGITDEMLQKEGKSKAFVIHQLCLLINEADIVIAHNKKFDQTVFESTCQKLGLPVLEKRWLCSLTEVPYPKKYTCKKLSHLAWEHDIPVSRHELHRAVYDVELMLALVKRYQLQNVLAYADEPWVYLQAIIPAPWTDGGVGKAKASKLNYGWEKVRGDDKTFPKKWVKRVKQSGLAGELAAAQKLNLDIQAL